MQTSVIRGVGSVRQCFSEENYSLHKAEAAYINTQLVVVHSRRVFPSAPRRYLPKFPSLPGPSALPGLPSAEPRHFLRTRSLSLGI